jgi:hypothetical protein
MYRTSTELIHMDASETDLLTLVNDVVGMPHPSAHLNTLILSITRPIAYADGIYSRSWPIFVVAKRIRAGEELRTYYGADYWSTRKSFSYSTQRLCALTRLNTEASTNFDLNSIPAAQLDALRAHPGDGSTLRGKR